MTYYILGIALVLSVAINYALLRYLENAMKQLYECTRRVRELKAEIDKLTSKEFYGAS